MSSESPPNLADLIPLAEDSDPEEVATALETAQVFAARDPKEALRWLRRASEAAADAGRDNRSLALARTAADLASQLSSLPSTPAAAEAPAVAPPPPTAAAAETEQAQPTPSVRPPAPSERRSSLPTPPPKPSVRPSAPSSAPAPSGFVTSAPPTSVLSSAAPSAVTSAPEDLTPQPPSVVSRPSGAEAAPPKTASLTPSPARSVGKSIPPAKPAKPAKPSRAPASPSVTPATPSAPSAPSVKPPAAAAAAVSRPAKPSYTTPQALLGSEGSQIIERLIREGRAETVSVKRSARDPSLFVVRTGAAQGLGTRKALIVLLEDDADFFSDEQPEFAN